MIKETNGKMRHLDSCASGDDDDHHQTRVILTAVQRQWRRLRSTESSRNDESYHRHDQKSL